VRKVGALGDLSSDLVIVGAGPAGVAAAVRASESGSNVLLIDDNLEPGGQIWKDMAGTRRGLQAKRWTRRLAASDVKVLSGAQAIAASAQGRWLYVETAERAKKVHFSRLILATGAREVFLPFPGWTLPGVFGVGGLQSLVKSGLSVAGKKIVLAGTGPLLLAVAVHLRKAGANVRLIAEQAPQAHILRFALALLRYPRKLGQAVALQSALAQVRKHFGCWVERAEGDRQLRVVHLREGSRTWSEQCDFAGIAYGLAPNTELGALLGCRVSDTGIAVSHAQESTVDGVLCAGECTGIAGLDLSIIEGEIAGHVAAGQHRRASALFARRNRARAFASSLLRAFALRPELKQLPRSDTIVCRCEDVTWSRVQQYHSFREAKLHGRCGMGPCQARVCGASLRFLLGWETDSIRPPILPARIETLAMQGPEGGFRNT
jgi:NADPH-dependent 2,4-dienoyl-CoA reductase/sulfur reductase-like enzyme